MLRGCDCDVIVIVVVSCEVQEKVETRRSWHALRGVSAEQQSASSNLLLEYET